MNVDTAIQEMLFNSTDLDIENLVLCADIDRLATISRYQSTFDWTISQCEEFLDNAALAYKLLVKGVPA